MSLPFVPVLECHNLGKGSFQGRRESKQAECVTCRSSIEHDGRVIHSVHLEEECQNREVVVVIGRGGGRKEHKGDNHAMRPLIVLPKLQLNRTCFMSSAKLMISSMPGIDEVRSWAVARGMNKMGKNDVGVVDAANVPLHQYYHTWRRLWIPLPISLPGKAPACAAAALISSLHHHHSFTHTHVTSLCKQSLSSHPYC